MYVQYRYDYRYDVFLLAALTVVTLLGNIARYDRMYW
jgi:hypothetical protein